MSSPSRMPEANCCQARAAEKLEVSAVVVTPCWSDSWKICPTLLLSVAFTLRSASAAFVRYCPFGSEPWSTLTVYCPAVVTDTDQRPVSSVVAVWANPPGPATSTATPVAGFRSESRIVPRMQPLVGLTVQGPLLAGAVVAPPLGLALLVGLVVAPCAEGDTAQSTAKVARKARKSTAASTRRLRPGAPRRNPRSSAGPGGVMEPTDEPLVRMSVTIGIFCVPRVSSTSHAQIVLQP